MIKNVIIEETKANIRRMSFNERREVAEFLKLVDTPPGSMTIEEACMEATHRSLEIDEGQVRPMTHVEVFDPLSKQFSQ